MGSFWKNDIDGFGGQYAFIHFPSLQVGLRWWFLTYFFYHPETWGSDIERISQISSPFERSIHHVFVVEKSGKGSGYSNEGRIFFERKFSCCFSRIFFNPHFFLVGGVFTRKQERNSSKIYFFPERLRKGETFRAHMKLT